MIYVEQHILNEKTLMPTASIMKYFTSISEFNEFYKLAKLDPCVLINVCIYNPEEKPGQKAHFDARLYSTSREIVI